MKEEFDSAITPTKIFRAGAQGSLKMKNASFTQVLSVEGRVFFHPFCHILIWSFSLFQADQLRTPARKAFVLFSSCSQLKVPVLQGGQAGQQDKVNYAVSEKENGVRVLGCNLAVVGCTELYWTVLDCFGLYWAVLDCSQLYWDERFPTFV